MITLVFGLLIRLAGIYQFILLLYCIFSMLYGFGVLDGRNRIVWQIGEFLARITEPVLQPVRSVLPAFGNLDLSPLVVMLAIQYLVIPGLRALWLSLISGSMAPLTM
ncbi:YggT family protein [Acetobacter sp. AN02]|uniref:YggT family protein n=1 Tax=Acetobacter sp. AN02 TaxID=2894186 RepID=UPI0024346456|nr:YggT family protein [Acetobacter sp. AN02]MDG6094150.1 YggT family protein [Acetobacter sp. AN02]